MSKINIDFEVKSDLYYLKIFDLSSWDLIAKSASIIEILRPGYITPHTAYFDKNKVNIFNSVMLGESCTNCDENPLALLEDGIWVITVKGSPSTFFKEHKFLNTSNIQLEIDKIYIDSFHRKERIYILEQLTEIEFLIKGAEAHLRYDMEKECSMLFTQAMKMVDKLTHCKDCKDPINGMFNL